MIKVLVTLVIVNILLSLILLIRSPLLVSASSPSQQTSSAQVIHMTSDGFKPQTMEISWNTTVKFVNDDTQPHWPASNPHPTHEGYPGFDPKQPVSPGSSWSFVFDRVGKWRFHDHLNPHVLGTIVVTGEESSKSNPLRESSLKFIDGVKDLTSKISSFITTRFASSKAFVANNAELSNFKKLNNAEQIKSLQTLSDTQGPDKAWGFLKKEFVGQSNPSSVHDLAHLVGGLIFQKTGISGLNTCSEDFGFGCYHGFLDRAFAKSLADIPKAEAACHSLPNVGPYRSCVHGIGHGIASYYQDTDLKSALYSCQQLKDLAQFCYDGVFMEFARFAPQDTYSKDDLYKPCNDLDKQLGPIYTYDCGMDQAIIMSERFKMSFEDIAKVCLGWDSPSFQKGCVRRLGFMITFSNANFTPEKIVSACQKIGVDERIAGCAEAAAGNLIVYNTPGWQTISPGVCTLLPLSYQSECQQAVSQTIKDYGRDTI